MEKEFLSKCKCIYEVYPSVDGITIERRPVIYINKRYVYIKRPGNDDLCKVPFNRIYNVGDVGALIKLEEAINGYIPQGVYIGGMNRHTYPVSLYFWNKLPNIDKLREESLKNYEEYKKNALADKALEEFRKAKERYEKAQIRLAELKLKEGLADDTYHNAEM